MQKEKKDKNKEQEQERRSRKQKARATLNKDQQKSKDPIPLVPFSTFFRVLASCKIWIRVKLLDFHPFTYASPFSHFVSAHLGPARSHVLAIADPAVKDAAF